MNPTLKRLIFAGVLSLSLLASLGCSQRERREVRVEESQHEGEVTEEKPGEMVVE